MAPTPPTIPADGGASLLSYLSVIAPFVVVVAALFWAWPHISRAVAAARRPATPEPAPVTTAPEPETPAVVEYRSAELPPGMDLSIYREHPTS